MSALEFLMEQEKVRIRQLKVYDLPALEWGGEFKHYRRLYREVYDNMCSGQALIWVVDIEFTGIVGQLFVQLKSICSELADGLKRAYVYGVRVKPNYRNKGIGTSLLMTAEADLVRRGFQWIYLNVSRENDAGRRFYERHGYRAIAPESGRWSYLDHMGHRRHVHEPAWRMQKHISSTKPNSL